MRWTKPRSTSSSMTPPSTRNRHGDRGSRNAWGALRHPAQRNLRSILRFRQQRHQLGVHHAPLPFARQVVGGVRAQRRWARHHPVDFHPGVGLQLAGIFTFPELVHIPAGYVVESFCAYDNTADNPFNPTTRLSGCLGETSPPGMFVLFLQGVPYEGDGDISLSVPAVTRSCTTARTICSLRSPPARADQIRVGFHLTRPAKASLVLRDMQGRVVKTWLDGENLLQVTTWRPSTCRRFLQASTSTP